MLPEYDAIYSTNFMANDEYSGSFWKRRGIPVNPKN